VKAASVVGAVVMIPAAIVACGRDRHAGEAADADAASQGVEAAATPDLAVDLGGGATMEFVLVRPGAFTMGDAGGFPAEKPPHRVAIPRPFYLARCEVTQEQWQSVMGTNPSRCKGAKYPVENVSWDDCKAFLAKLNARTSGAEFVLPSEAQWEYACRAGSAAKWCFGDDEGRLAGHAWFLANSRGKTHAVGGRKPNAWGLYDMHGNAWEWCEDAWHETYDGAPTDGGAWTSDGDGRHVRRGGSWYDSAWLARCAYRLGFRADFRAENLGFRPARLAEP
jgi:formylglycine-generating enzyme required for sulfatase activity